MSLKSSLVEKFASNAKVVTCEETTTLAKVLDLMQEEHIGSICIVKEGKVSGIFTERDFLLKIGRKQFDLNSETISKFMTEDPVTVSEGASLYECMVQMKLGNFRHLIIVNDQHQPVRMLSIRDAFHYLFEELDT